MRQITKPKIDASEYAQPIDLGGTGVMSLAEIAPKLQIATNANKGLANETIPLNASGQIDHTRFPAITGMNKINLQGSFNVAVNQSVSWQITDYDSFKNYALSCTAGSINRVNDTVYYTAPSVAGAVTVTVAGRAINFNVLNSQPAQPNITSPVNGSANLNPTYQFTSSAFVYNGNADTHQSSDWQIATDSGFSNVVRSTTDDPTNKISWTPAALTLNTTQYVRVRYKGASGNYGAWSNPITFTTREHSTISSEEAKLVASDKTASDRFGYSISTDSTGTRVIIGAYNASPGGLSTAGAAYVFTRNGTSWAQEAKLTASDVTSGYNFGNSVSINSDGTRLVVGSQTASPGGTSQAGAAYVFVRSGVTWTQEAILAAADKVSSDSFGKSVSIDGTGSRIVVGSIYSASGGVTAAGAAYVFTRSGTSWAQEAKLTATDKAMNDLLGQSVSINTDGSRLIAGAFDEDPSGITDGGAAYVFLRTGTSWAQEAKLLATDAAASAYFGYSVSINSDASRAVIGSQGAAPGGLTSAGAAYVFLRTGTSWAQEAKLTASDKAASDNFGRNVCICGDASRVIIGSYNSSPGGISVAGSAYVFSRSGTVWTQESKLTASDKAAGDNFGTSVTIDGSGIRVIVGAAFEDPGTITDAGAAYVYY